MRDSPRKSGQEDFSAKVSWPSLCSTFAVFRRQFSRTRTHKKSDSPVHSLMLTRRIGKESDMLTLPKAAEPLVRAFSVAFTRPTFQRVTLLILGAILSLRHRTITGILRALGPLAK